MKCQAHDKYLKVVYRNGIPKMACATCGRKSKRLTVRLINLKNGFQEFKFEAIKSIEEQIATAKVVASVMMPDFLQGVESE